MFSAPKPGQLQTIRQILEDIPTRDVRVISQHLGVTTRTMARWIADDDAPRAARLALFWETKYGLSVANCEAVNDARLYYGMAKGHESTIRDLRTRIAYLEAVGDFGAANMPVYRAA